MKKAKIYIPNKSPMQSGFGKTDKWILEYETKDPTSNPLMGWESSSDTLTELKLEFSSKELAINYAKKKKIDYELIDPTHDHINHFLNLKNLNIYYFKKLSAYDFFTVFLFFGSIISKSIFFFFA